MKDKGCTCKTRNSIILILVGLILLANTYWPLIGWWTLAGGVLVLLGLLKLIMPGCSCG